MLVVDDDRATRELLSFHLERERFAVEHAVNGTRALASMRTRAYALIVLDVMLPDLDGLSVCRAIRAEGPNTATPILIVTARRTEADRVLGLESGADDYLSKPFGIHEFLARVHALLRRHRRAGSTEAPAPRAIEAGGVRVDLDSRRVTVRGRAIALTRHEFDVLVRLVAHRGTVFTRAALLRHMGSDDRVVTERTVDTLVSRLRKKIERNPHAPECILTEWGIGYRFAEPDPRD